MYLHIAWSLHAIIDSETVSESSLASILMKRNTLLEELDYFLNIPSDVEEGNKVGNQLACRVSSFYPDTWISASRILLISSSLSSSAFDLMMSMMYARFVLYLWKCGVYLG